MHRGRICRQLTMTGGQLLFCATCSKPSSSTAGAFFFLARDNAGRSTEELFVDKAEDFVDDRVDLLPFFTLFFR